MPDDGASIEKQNFDAIPKKIYQVPNISDLYKSNLWKNDYIQILLKVYHCRQRPSLVKVAKSILCKKVNNGVEFFFFAV